MAIYAVLFASEHKDTSDFLRICGSKSVINLRGKTNLFDMNAHREESSFSFTTLVSL